MNNKPMKLRIFVIDDEECIRDTLQWYLEEQGHEVLTASEPLTCSVYQGGRCESEFACGDLLIVDYNMPRMNGLDFIERMIARGCKGCNRNKMILTGDASRLDIRRVNASGCDLFLKPLRFATLDQWISEKMAFISPHRKLVPLADIARRLE